MAGVCVSLLRNSSVTVVTVVTVECAGAPTDRPTCGRVECDECGTDRPTRWEECGTRVGDSVKTRNAGATTQDRIPTTHTRRGSSRGRLLASWVLKEFSARGTSRPSVPMPASDHRAGPSVAPPPGARRPPPGPPPRGYPNWDTVAGVYRNAEGDTSLTYKERQALAARERRKRKRDEQLRAEQAARDAAASDDDDSESTGAGHGPNTHSAPTPPRLGAATGDSQ